MDYIRMCNPNVTPWVLQLNALVRLGLVAFLRVCNT